MGAVYYGVVSWEMERDDNGHRNYNVTMQVRTTDPLDGPAVVINCVGLPTLGTSWLVGNDEDDWAWVTPWTRVRPTMMNERNQIWLVDMKFTTAPMIRQSDQTVENPLNEPAKVSGGFTKYTEEATYDRFGNFLLMSSFELMKGPQVEVERGRPTVRVTLNRSSLPLATFSQFRGGVNDSTLWGLPARTIRLADIAWERNVYGGSTYYYTVTYDFEIKYETWNRYIVDQGQYRKINKNLPLSNTNPLVPLVDDLTGRWYTGYLDGSAGLVAAVGGNPNPAHLYVWEKQIEPQYNFLSLGIPSSL
jgi:hypothetical protein